MSTPARRSGGAPRRQPVVVDWDLAGRIGGRLARPGPTTTDAEATAVVAELADVAVRAEAPVREVTGLADGLAVPEALVVDRPRWVAAAADSMGRMTGTAKVAGGRGPGVSGRVAAAQTGPLLAYLSGAILGQFDPFTGEGGTLLLVAPNVVAVERTLRVDPTDFRLWVCLHEVTHRVQFTASSWLTGYMADTVGTLTAGMDLSGPELAGRIGGLLREGRRPDSVVGVLRALQAPPQQEALDRLLALGTLLEGHADHVMDAVGPAVVPSVARIRARFDQRRRRPTNPLQRVLRALLGVDTKIAQYERGKRFVDAVVDQVGMAGFNAVWTSPETLPTEADVVDPARWVARVHG
ncbi:zinc-dependent metalloprotease [Rhodococcus aerolatus]